MVELSNVDFKALEGGAVEQLALTGEEKQAVKMLKDYEERARQQRMYGDENKNVEGKRDGSEATGEAAEPEDIMIFGFRVRAEKLGLPFVLVLFTAMGAAFWYCRLP